MNQFNKTKPSIPTVNKPQLSSQQTLPALTELAHLTARYYRGLLLEPKSQKHLMRKQKGDTAEDELVAILEKTLPEKCQIMRNVWLEFNGGTTEVDILVIMQKFWWPIEVKNYTGQFEYRQQICYLNQTHFPDQIAACRNRLRILKSIANELPGYRPEIHCTMAFMNERCQVVADDVSDFQLIMRYQLLWHIDEMLELNRQLPDIISLQGSLEVIRQNQIPSPFAPKSLDVEVLKRVTTGIRCPQCHSYDNDITQHKVICRICQHATSKTESVLRAACELGTLYFDHPTILTSANLYEFTGRRIGQRNLQLILKANLPNHGAYRTAHYHNYGLPYDQIKGIFTKISPSKRS